MSSTMSILEGAFIMFTFCIVGFGVAFASGIALDNIYDELAASGVLDVPARWSPMEDIDFLIALHYGGLYLIPVLGVVIFILNTIRIQRYDRYAGQQYYGGRY